MRKILHFILFIVVVLHVYIVGLYVYVEYIPHKSNINKPRFRQIIENKIGRELTEEEWEESLEALREYHSFDTTKYYYNELKDSTLILDEE